jgi:hypothetical protein
MKKIAFWALTSGAAMLAGCGRPETENSVAANDSVADNVVEAVPSNAAAPSNEGAPFEPANMSATDGAPPVQRAAPAPAPRPARGTDKQTVPQERRADRPAPPVREPAPAPPVTCTPEHEAMGHCKQ